MRTRASLVAIVATALRGRHRDRISGDAAAGAGGGAAGAVLPRSRREKGGQDPFGAYEIVKDWPKPISAAAGPDQMDVGRRRGRLRRNAESRVHPAARPAAEPRAAEDHQAAAARTEHRVPDRPPAVARRDVHQPARSARNDRRQGRRRLRRGRQRHGLQLVAHHHGRRCAGQPRSRIGRSGTRCSAARTRSTSAPTIRRSACSSSTTTARRCSSSRTTASSC